MQDADSRERSARQIGPAAVSGAAAAALRDWHPRQLRRALRERLETTPGRLLALAAALAVACLLLGGVGVWTLQRHADAASDVALRSQRVSAAALQVYSSLAGADTAAASSFVAGGRESAPLRARYQQQLARAQSALTEATAAAGGRGEPATLAAAIAQRLPVYAGLIEQARANRRQGFPISVGYLSAASDLMRGEMLVSARRLYELEAARLRSDQDRAGSFAWPLLLVGLLALAVLALAQVRLYRATRRVFNPGLVGATLAVLVALVWSMAALGAQGGAIDDSRSRGSAQIEPLAQARIEAARARGDESLFLISSDAEAYRADYAEAAAARDRALESARAIDTDATPIVVAAREAAVAWNAAHTRLEGFYREGRDDAAVRLAAGAAPDTAASQSARLDQRLAEAIESDQTALERHARSADDSLDGLVPGVIVLAVLALAGSLVGIWLRLREYR